MKVLVLIFACVAYVAAQCPTIVTRAEWGAIPGSSTILPTRPAPWYVIHHTAGSSCSTKTSCSAEMRAIQHYHINGNGWNDIGYNFLVGGDGLIYEGRGWGKQGAHAPGYNDKSIGISFIGTFTNDLPKDIAITAAKQLIDCGVSLGHAQRSYKLIGHRQATSTECPGNKLYDEIKNWPNYTPNP